MLKNLLSHTVPAVSVSEISSEEIVFLDARERKEFDVSKIKGAKWVGYNDFSMERVEEIDKKSKIVVYCSVGYRSEKIAEKLIASGFTNVSNLYGGIFEWKNQGKDVVDESDNFVQKVHAYNKVWGVWLRKGERVYK
jgi:rhodanese-related sulfurtransferase